MANNKFGADYYTPDGRVGGHIYITPNTFKWQPVRFLFIGAGINDIEFPLSQLEGYKKDGTTLYIGVKGYSDLFPFYTWKGRSIVDVIRSYNPEFRMYASNEVS